MSEFTFVMYALVFRLAVLGIAMASIWAGYRLFVLGVMPASGTYMEGALGEVRLTLKNAAPGTCFAAFGASIVVFLLIQGIPERIEKQDGAGTASPARYVSLRGETPLSTGTGTVAELRDRLSDPALPLAQAAPLLRDLAARFSQEDRFLEAATLLRLAYGVTPSDPHLLKLMSETEMSLGNRDTALTAMEAAVRLDPALAPDLETLRRTLEQQGNAQ